MADYTDIDKLRELEAGAFPVPWSYSDDASVMRGALHMATVYGAFGDDDPVATAAFIAAVRNALPALITELVGLRTEVDQLRTDNERLREFIMTEREKCSFDGPLPTGSWPDVALQLIRHLLGRRDALQAEVRQLRGALSQERDRCNQHAEDAASLAALQARVDAVEKLLTDAATEPFNDLAGEAASAIIGQVAADCDGHVRVVRPYAEGIAQTVLVVAARAVAALGVDPQKEAQQ